MLLALPFLILLGVVLPLLAWASLRQTRAAAETQAASPTVRAVAVQIGVVQIVVGLAER